MFMGMISSSSEPLLVVFSWLEGGDDGDGDGVVGGAGVDGTREILSDSYFMMSHFNATF